MNRGTVLYANMCILCFNLCKVFLFHCCDYSANKVMSCFRSQLHCFVFQCLYEVITSETSYVKSLDIVQSHFMRSLGDKGLISKGDFSKLFSNMNKIVEAASE